MRVASAAASPRRLQGATVYVNWFPCNVCASLLAMSKVKRVVGHDDRWADECYNFETAYLIMREAGVEVTKYSRVSTQLGTAHAVQ